MVPDLILDLIAKHLPKRDNTNQTLLRLRLVSRSFENKRHIFIKYLVLSPAQSIKIWNSKDPFWYPYIGRVYTLDLSLIGVTDVSALGGLHTLYLSLCNRVTNVSALGRLHTLDLSCTGVTDVSALGGLHTLNLTGCTGVTDVSALGKLHTLNLRGTSVTDISMLQNVKNLYR